MRIDVLLILLTFRYKFGFFISTIYFCAQIHLRVQSTYIEMGGKATGARL